MPYKSNEDKIAYERKYRKKNLKKIQKFQRGIHNKRNKALSILRQRHPEEFKFIMRGLK